MRTTHKNKEKFDWKRGEMRLSLFWTDSTRSRAIFTQSSCVFRAFRTQFSLDFTQLWHDLWRGYFTQFSPYSSATAGRIERIEERWMTGWCWRRWSGNRSVPGPDFCRPPNAGELVFLVYFISDIQRFITQRNPHHTESKEM